MESKEKTIITVQAKIKAPIEIVWKNWTTPDDIVKWNNASDDWHTTRAKNDLQIGGKFLSRMEAKDGSMGFDFEGVYSVVITNEHIEYIIADGREVEIDFTVSGNETNVVETFEAESINSIELQRTGWQAILDSFKKYDKSNCPLPLV
jgi:uncharacterized protein YndB with AHSA1/START domain